MKYFKYRNINKVQQLAYKERLASLGKDEQKKIKIVVYKKSNVIKKILTNI